VSMPQRILALGCLIIANGVAWFLPHGFVRTPAHFNAEAIPVAIGGFQGTDVPVPDSIPRLLGATDVLNRRYRSPDGVEIELFIAFYATQNLGREPHDPEVCLVGGGWKFREKRVIALPVRDPLTRAPVPATEHRADQAGWSLAALSFHVGPAATFPSPGRSKWSRIVESVRSFRTDGLFVRVLSVEKGGGPPRDNGAAVREFTCSIAPAIYAAYAGR
jgi:EpsI family protein